MYFFAPTFGAVSSTLSLMPAYYGIADSVVGYINVIANPAACIAGLFVGAFAGSKLSYKATSITAMGLFIVFGSLPFLWQGIPFEALLISRFLFGLGCGCINPVVQAVITHMIKSETARSAWIGIINAIFSVGASVGTLITGVLSNDGVWQNAYAFYIFAIIPFILIILFFKDSEISGGEERPAAAAVSDAPKEKRSIPAITWGFIIIFMFNTIITGVFFGYAGVAMGSIGIDPAMIGLVFSIFTVAGIVIALLNAAMWKLFRLWNLPISYALFAIGYVLCIIAFNTQSVVLFIVASVIIGVGCCLCGMCLPMILSVTVPAAALTFAIGLQEVARNLGSFLSSPWLQGVAAVFGDNPVSQFTAVCIASIVVAVVSAVFAVAQNKRFKDAEMKKM
jgi:MFS family permease